MPVILRMNTFPTGPRDWLDKNNNPTMSFREYNAKVWEPWISRAYSSETKPFTDRPESSFAKQLDAVMQAPAMREPFSGQLERFKRWEKLNRREKEDLLLDILEVHHRMSEEMEYGMTRAEAPECNLAALVDNDGYGMKVLALKCSTPPDFAVSTSSVPVYHHDAWDRVWSVGKYSPQVPFSRAKRLSIEYSTSNRAGFLLSLVNAWKRKMDYGGSILPMPLAPPISLNASTAPRLFGTGSRDEIDGLLSTRKEKYDKRCEKCHVAEGQTSDTHLLCCARCKNVDRWIWYCSTEHQKEDWALHKRICGKKWEETPSQVDILGQ
ncbi:hypothetical protein JCM6882_006645 [Rhodosporidiobolus microsporus]